MNETEANETVNSNNTPRGRRWRVCPRVMGVLVLLMLGGCIYNNYALHYGRREAERIAATEYGAAFEGQDFHGSGELGVLFLHGLYGTPRDFAGVMSELREHDIDYYAPMNGGDRPSPLTQMGFTATSLGEHAQRSYEHLAQRCERIVVVGFSLGGVQAADVASRNPVAGAVLVSPGFFLTKRWYIQPSLETLVRWTAHWLPIIPRKSPGRVNDPEARKTYAGMRTTCTIAALALIEYSEEIQAGLPGSFGGPLLVVLSHGDEVIDPDGAAELLGALEGAESRFVWYERSNHNPLVDYDRDEANREVTEFILEQVGSGGE